MYVYVHVCVCVCVCVCKENPWGWANCMDRYTGQLVLLQWAESVMHAVL